MKFLPIGVIGIRGNMDSNIELILQVRAGSDDAFMQMCEQYKKLIDSMSHKYFGMCANEYCSQDDFLQEAKMAFYNAIIKYDTDTQKVTFGAFAKVCIRNRLISCIRKQSSKKRRRGKNNAEIENSNWSLQDTVVQRELGEKLISAAENTLSDYEKRIFSFYLEGRKAKEISSILGKSEKSVNNAIYRIRSKLKRTVS